MAPDNNYDFSGVWLSTYTFTSGVTGDLLETEHYVTMQRLGNQLVIQSIPNTSGSYMMARFTLDGPIATGSYQSQNSPLSSTKGAIYYGAAQLVLDDNGKIFRGMGIGYGKDMKVKPSDWQIEHVGQRNVSRKELQKVRFNEPVATKEAKKD
ncbi:MAG TPA: hypothetical protein VGO07_03335 [Candidatus Saccharimonadales bacterium]|jgi:hypothetical protein|nr:hypothetical protein [Candidatus Saccharimonadales bacterium]